MAQYKYVDEMNSILGGMAGPLTRGPPPRWQKKGLENSSNNINISSNSSKQKSLLSTSNASTSKSVNGSDTRTKKTPSKTPSKNKSPSRSTTPTPNKRSNKTPNKGSKTPNKGSKTPNGADRFIPVRSASKFELGYFKLQSEDQEDEMTDSQKALAENLHGNDMSNQRILAYQHKAPVAPEGYQNPMRVIYTQTKTPASVKNSSRYIPQCPDRILDAPDIVDDYYLNLMDWSANNVLACALGNQVYLWNAGTGNIETLHELDGNDYVCSLSWLQEGDYLAVGTTTGTVELWDCAKMKRLRSMEGHSSRVASLSWNAHVLSSGCRGGLIIHHDVRQRDHVISTINAHSLEVCGLKWSTDGKYLASGGNDNVLNIWSSVANGNHSQNTPLYSFSSHQAAVKALAWCPWKPNVLASGGGTADRCIKFWNRSNGTMINSVDTKSQVCALLWSKTFNELISGHGFANNQLTIWKYPMMNKVAELTGHTARVLHLAMSPDGTTVMSAGADETLRLWKCFVPDPSKKKDPAPSKVKNSIFTRSIR